jgi:hypothetical protein
MSNLSLTRLERERIAPIGRWITWSLIGWAAFWAAFLVAFPWSRTQAIFLWNPRVRGLLSLWFVPLLLLLLPPLRRSLLAPFRDDLLAGARISDLPDLGYFEQFRSRLDGGSPALTRDHLLRLRGTVVIRAGAGLGKTSALRWLAAQVNRPVAFLSARECADGVDVAIARLVRDVQETGFVRSMVHTGSLVVIIDGLNEVSAETREKVGTFARDMSKGDVVMATQPIEWKPPQHAHVLDLLPLDRDEAEQFLASRPIGKDERQPCHGNDYFQAVATFLDRGFDKAPSEDARHIAELMLSNPFDLSLAADLLAQGSMPQATALIDEAFRPADVGSPTQPGYRSVTGQPFPLERFAQHAINMRLEDRNWFKSDEFPAEISCLLERRLLVNRAVRGYRGKNPIPA